MKKFIFLIVFLVNLFLPPVTLAQQSQPPQFATSYNVTYDVFEDGVTEVTEEIRLKNLTDRFYASNFTLIISSTQISDLKASDSSGDLPVKTTKQGNQTQIDITLTQQISGLNKEYPFSLKFKSRDFAERQGNIWQVTLPKITSPQTTDNFDLTLSVPVSFGDPSTILPEPISTSERGGKLQLKYTKNQLLESGILANFGAVQQFSVTINSDLKNDGVLPYLYMIPLPVSINFQQVLINSITPNPENVLLDQDGNHLAYFKVAPKQNLNVEIKGLAKLAYNFNTVERLTDEQKSLYTKSEKYWEKDSPQIQATLKEIFKGETPISNKEKAQLINQYLVNNIGFQNNRLTSHDFSRLGALTTLTNPGQALAEDFTDLFIALARAAGIPARELIGFAYSSNQETRPKSFEGNFLHVWPEYYDQNLGWLMIDPTWQTTSGGTDYFSKFDLNHLVVGIRGLSSEQPTPQGEIKVDFSESEFMPNVSLKGEVLIPSEIFAGLPFKSKFKIKNQGNSLSESTPFKVRSEKLILSGNTQGNTPKLPPRGFVEYELNTKTNSLWEGFSETVTLEYGDQTVSKTVLVRPFFSYNNFTVIVISVVGAMILGYLLTFGIHFKKTRKNIKSEI